MAIPKPSLQEPAEKKTGLLTGEELAEMGDIGPCELVEGRLVPMSPTKSTHGATESNFARILGTFVHERDLGQVQVGEVGIYTRRNPDTVRGADLLFISRERLAQATPGSFLDVAPELVVEIMSPTDRWTEVKKKLREYLAIGTKVVLVVDPEEKTVSVHRSLTDVRELAVGDALAIEEVLPSFRVDVAELFPSPEKTSASKQSNR
jgi:Uma2 family endonuclease